MDFASLGRTLSSTQISLSKILSEFNTHVQLDFFLIVMNDENPILNIADTQFAYFETVLLPNRGVELVAKAFEQFWINRYGNP